MKRENLNFNNEEEGENKMNPNLQDAVLMLVNSGVINLKELAELCNNKTDEEVFLAIENIRKETIFRTKEKVRLSTYLNRYIHEKQSA